MEKKKMNPVFGIWRSVYPIIIYFMISIVVQCIYTIPLSVKIASQYAGDIVKTQEVLMKMIVEKGLLLTGIGAFISIPIFYLFMKADAKKKLVREGKVTYEKASLVQWLFIIFSAFGFCLFTNLVISLTGLNQLSAGFDQVAATIYQSQIWMQIIVTVILAPVVEELLFRGLVQRRLNEFTKPIVAMILSAVIFGAYHMNLVQFVYATLFGLCLSFIYDKFQTIWAPILFHVAGNLMSIIVSNSKVLHNWFESTVVVAIFLVVSLVVLVVTLVYFFKMKLSKTVEEPAKELEEVAV